MIPKGCGKYLIIKVLKVTWQKYDENLYCPGSYIMWKYDSTLSSQMIDFHPHDGESNVKYCRYNRKATVKARFKKKKSTRKLGK